MHESPSAYLPEDRRQALAHGRALPDRADGAALFADISGFTPLTEMLAQSLGSRRGAEALSEILNDVYGALIAEVELLAGSVIGFSGDAITCWFEGRPDGGAPDRAGAERAQAEATARAVACGLAMQRAAARYAQIATPGGGTASIAIKVAVAAGPVRRFLAGDTRYGRQDVVAGGTLDRLAAAEHAAARGEVVVDAPTAALLGARLALAEWRDDGEGGRAAPVVGIAGEVRPQPWDLPDLPDEEPWWLPAGVAGRLRSGLAAFPADLRPVVALFLNFGGIDYDREEDAPFLLDAFIRRVQGAVANYDGALLQLTTGDKGSYLLVSFGAPTAHDDDAARAVGCAHELIGLARQLGYVSEPRIGIARGVMYCGAYGGPNRRCYGVLSDATNLAARLMQAAPPGETRCDEQAARAAGRAWTFDELPALRLKGKATPVPVFRPVGRRAGGDAWRIDGVTVGREAELALVDAALERLARGEGGVLLVSGEAGIGKSRLANELLERSRARGFGALAGLADSIEQRTPYRAWMDVLAALLGLEPGQTRERQRELVAERAARLAPRLEQRLPLLNDVLALQLPDTPLTAALDAALRHESLQGLLVAMLRAEAQARPLALVLEDVQWLDGPSWELVGRLGRALQADDPLLLVLTHRQLGAESAGVGVIGALAELPAAQAVALGALPPEALEQLVHARLGLPAGALPTEVAELVRARAGGNPFFAEELLLALREQRLISVTQELGPRGEPGPVRCSVDPQLTAGAVLPDTLHGLVLARIDRLPAEHQLALKVAAVIGRSFAETTLHATLSRYRDLPRPVLRSQLVDLAVNELTALEGLQPELTYIFKHLITQEVAYELLLFAQRREIHRTVAEWYEASGALELAGARSQELEAVLREPRPAPGLPPVLANLLAHHYRQAELGEREWVYAALSGAQAAGRYANAEAAAALGRALELAPPERRRERFALLLRRERVRDTMGAREAQQADVAALQALAEELADGRLRAEAALRAASYAEVTSDYPAALAEAGRAVELARGAGAADLAAAGALRRGRALILQAEYDAAQAPLAEAIDTARAAARPDIAADGLRNLGLAALNRGEYAAAKEYASAAIAAFQEAGDRRGETMAIANVGAAAYFQADYAGAREAFVQALRLAQEIGDRLAESDALLNIGNVAREQGDFAQARGYYERALPLCRQIGDRWGESASLNGLGAVAAAQVRYEDAIAYQGEAIELSRAIADRLGEAIAMTNLADAALQVGRRAQAREALGSALALFHEAGDRRNAAWAVALQALADEHEGAYETSLALAADAARAAEEVGARSVEALALAVRGRALLGLGRAEEAHADGARSLELRRELGEHLLMFDSLALLADAAGALGRRAEARERAAEIMARHETAGGLHGLAEPPRAYLACAVALRAEDPARARAALDAGAAALLACAETVSDAAMRRSLLEDVPAHRQLLQLRHREDITP